MIDWSGIFHILATPFTDDGALDVEGLPRLVEAVLATGVSGLTILGIAGEAHRLNDEERLLYHQEHSGPLMDKLKTWLKEQIDEKRVEPNSSLGKAISYMRKRWDNLTLFLHVPGAPLDNNIAERALKKAILHRKNALFYKTENGARVGDIFMSLIHTAELAGANAFDYLTVLLQHTAEVRRNPRQWLPWTYTSARSAGDEGP